MCDIMEYFNNYVNSDIIHNEGYDCSEIAEDFKSYLGSGDILTVEVRDGRGKFFNVQEFGVLKRYVYHNVYVLEGYVYDPRYKKHPVKEEEYKYNIQRVNKDMLEFSYE